MRIIRTAALLVAWHVATTSAIELPEFEEQVVDAQVAIGYGLALEDVDGDGKRDILLADQRQFVWYKNPTWKRFVLAENLTEHDNVCIAARDIDGDGKCEIAVGAEWDPSDTTSSGAVFYLDAPDDRTKMWKPIRLHHEPVVHRMRWVRTGKDHFVLVVAPLHGKGNQGGKGSGVRLLAYQKPADPTTAWKTQLLDDRLHVTHNFDRGQWVGGDETPEEIVYLGREGALLLNAHGDHWHKGQFANVAGGGEIRIGHEGDERFLAVIEPFHGDKLVYYHVGKDNAMARMVLDDQLNQGHAIATADFSGDGQDEIVAGWRNANDNRKYGVKLYFRSGDQWDSVWVDDNGMACEDLRVADLDGDGRLDIVAAGRSTHNLKIYWNRDSKRPVD